MKETKLVRSAWAAAGAGRIVAGDATGSGRWARVEYTGRNVYDGLDRLERATEGYWGRTTEFWYNRAGARTGTFFPGETVSPPPGSVPSAAPSLSYRYDAANRLVAANRTAAAGGKASALNFRNGEPAHRRNGAAWSAGFQPADVECGDEAPGQVSAPGQMQGRRNTALEPRGALSPDADTSAGARTSRPHDAAIPRAVPGAWASSADSPDTRPEAASYADSPIHPFTDSPTAKTDDSSVASYEYFPDGLVHTIRSANGAVTTYAYYPNRWVQAIDTRAGSRRISRYEYEYDANGNRTLMREWNATPAWRAAHPAWETDPDDVAEHEVTVYTYDRLDRLNGVTYRYGTAEQRAVAYTYDLLGNRLSELETKLDGTPVKHRAFAYDRHGRLLHVTDHLAPGRSVSYEYSAAGDTLSKTIGQLDGAGQIVPGTEALRLNFGWDAWGRLRRVTRQTADTGKWSQAKTGDGRRETGAEPAGMSSAGMSSASAGLSLSNSKVSAPSALGDEELVAEFCYDHAGRRIRKDGRFVFLGDGAGGPGDPVPSDTRFYVYDQQSCLAEYAPDPAQPADPSALVKTRQYIYGSELISAESWIASDQSPAPKSQVPSPSSQSPGPRSQSPGPSSVFYHQDALGSTVNLTAGGDVPGGPAAGAVTASYLYDAWGNYRELDTTDPADPGNPLFDATPDLGPDGLYAWDSYLSTIQFAFDPASLELPAPSLADWNRFTYTGHEFDPETGLYYFKARFYDPELGRFASEDQFEGSALTPPSLQRYCYANSNPLTFVDRTGYWSDKRITTDATLVTAVEKQDLTVGTGSSKHPIDALLDRFNLSGNLKQRFLQELIKKNPRMIAEDGSWQPWNHPVWRKDLYVPLTWEFLGSMKPREAVDLVMNSPRLMGGTTFRDQVLQETGKILHPWNTAINIGLKFGAKVAIAIIAIKCPPVGLALLALYGPALSQDLVEGCKELSTPAGREAVYQALEDAPMEAKADFYGDILIAAGVGGYALKGRGQPGSSRFSLNRRGSLDIQSGKQPIPSLGDLLRENLKIQNGGTDEASSRAGRVTSPNAIARRAAQGEYVDPMTNQIVRTTEPLAADHIIPQRVIKQLEGFDRLTAEQKAAVLNRLENFQGLPKTFNSSKGGQMPGDWQQYRGQPLNPNYINRNQELQPKLLKELQEMINNYRNPMGS